LDNNLIARELLDATKLMKKEIIIAVLVLVVYYGTQETDKKNNPSHLGGAFESRN
jgi:hypothetical protein